MIGNQQQGHNLFQSGFVGDQLALQKRDEIKKPDVSDLIASLDEAQDRIKLIHGANEDEYPLANQTVAQVRSQMDRLFNIAPDATPFVDGIQVDEDHVLQAGTCIEFLRATGKKARLTCCLGSGITSLDG